VQITRFIIIFLGVFLALLLPDSVQAQDEKPALQWTINRQNNFTYTSRNNLYFLYQKDRYRMQIRANHDILLNPSRPDNPFIQLYFRTSFWQFFQISKKWELTSWFEADQFFNTGNQRYSIYAGATYYPTTFLSVTPIFGYSWDYRSKILDEGVSPGILLRMRNQREDGLETRTDIFARNKYINPRHQRNIQISSEWAKTFGHSAGVAFEIQGGSNEMNDYTSQSIEKIIADTVSGRLGLQYQLLKGVFLESTNQITYSRRKFDYELFENEEPEFNDLSFNQINLYTRQKLSYSASKLDAFFTYEYEYLGRRYELENSMDLPDAEFERLLKIEEEKDYFRNLTNLEMRINYRPLQKHTFSLIGTNRYLQFDTPSEDNFSDHDQLNYGLSGEWRTSWSKDFSTRYKLIGSVRKYAFLFKERSQDNYTQRNLRMEFDYRWQLTPKLLMRGSQFIYVTYNVKDFEDRNLTDRSTRNLESKLFIRYRPKQKATYQLSLYRKEFHVSYLNWEAFTETTLDTNTIYIIENINEFQIKSPWEKTVMFLDLGYKHFSQLRFLNTSMTSTANILTPINLHIRNHQTGPVTGLRFLHKKPANFELSIWWQLQYQDNKYSETDKIISLTTNYRETNLQKVNVYFRPFFRLKANIFFAQPPNFHRVR
jgi:hypothetical protein